MIFTFQLANWIVLLAISYSSFVYAGLVDSMVLDPDRNGNTLAKRKLPDAVVEWVFCNKNQKAILNKSFLRAQEIRRDALAAMAEDPTWEKHGYPVSAEFERF